MTRVPQPRTLGIIPARGGSKRLARKNITPLAERPLISYTIEAACASAKLTDFLVSSEDPEILQIAREEGAPTPFIRCQGLATDTVRNNQVVLDALRKMESKTGSPYDMVFLLQPTSPIRDPRHIDECIDLLWHSKLDTLASVKGPYQKRDPILKKLLPDGSLAPYRDSLEDDPREAFFIYNAAIYGVKRKYLVHTGSLVSQIQVPYVMDEIHSIDIDTKEDLFFAEFLIKQKINLDHE